MKRVQYLWYFLNEGFKFQQYVCKRCHNLPMMSMSHFNICFLNIKGVNSCCIINGIGKSEATNLMQNIDLTEKSKALQKPRAILKQ